MNKQNNIKKQLRLTKRDSSLIRQLLKIPKAEPLKKSSSMNQLKAIHQLLLDASKKIIYIQAPINKQMWSNQLKPLDFAKYNQYHSKPLYRTCYRYFNHEHYLAFLDSISQIIKIQTNYRCYSSKKQFYLKAKDYFQAKGLNAIVIIQSKIRQFLLVKQFKLNLLINAILFQRKTNFIKIEENMQRFYIQNKKNMQMIYVDIVRKRTKSAIKIQSLFRKKVVNSNLLSFKIKIKTHYYLVYPFKTEKISLKIFFYEDDTPLFKILLYHFEYNSYLKLFMLFIPFTELPSGKYRCQFIIDGIETCDGQYPHIEFSDGLFYNLIDFNKPKRNNINDYINDNTHDSDDNKTDDIKKLEDDLCNLPNQCFFDEMKHFRPQEDFLSLRIDLYGKKFQSKMDEILNEPFSKIELKFNN